MSEVTSNFRMCEKNKIKIRDRIFEIFYIAVDLNAGRSNCV